MPSGAKKRKAAKKKMRKDTHNANNQSEAHSQGNDDTKSHEDNKSHDERESDGGEFEREEEEVKRDISGDKDSVNPQQDSAIYISKEERDISGDKDSVNPQQDSAIYISKEEVSSDAKAAENSPLEKDNGHEKSSESTSSSSSSSSSSDDEEISIEKERTVVESEEVKENVENGTTEEIVKPSDYLPEQLAAGGAGASVEVCNVVEERIPDVESVKEVIPAPQVAVVNAQSALVENSDHNAVDPELKDEEVEAPLPGSDEKENIAPVPTYFSPAKEAPVAEESSGHSYLTVLTGNGNEDKLKSSDAPLTETSLEMDNDKDLNAHKPVEDQVDAPIVQPRNGVDRIKDMDTQQHSENQPLITSTPLPVRRTSVLGCCGLLEVLKGSSR